MKRTCALTGASGYLGTATEAALRRQGWEVLRLVRSPRAVCDVELHLGTALAPSALRDVDALIHCAHDARSSDPYRSNVQGSIALFQAAQAAGVRRMVFVSSVSAFDGCRSQYGRGKLEVERAVASFAAISVRPGLIWGGADGGTFGALVRLTRLRLLPVFDGGTQPLVLAEVHELADALVAALAWDPAVVREPVVLAHPRRWPFAELLAAIAARAGRSIRTFSVPSSAALLLLRIAERAGLPLPLRSDNLLGLLFPASSFEHQLADRLGARFSAFPSAPDGGPLR